MESGQTRPRGHFCSVVNSNRTGSALGDGKDWLQQSMFFGSGPAHLVRLFQQPRGYSKKVVSGVQTARVQLVTSDWKPTARAETLTCHEGGNGAPWRGREPPKGYAICKGLQPRWPAGALSCGQRDGQAMEGRGPDATPIQRRGGGAWRPGTPSRCQWGPCVQEHRDLLQCLWGVHGDTLQQKSKKRKSNKRGACIAQRC